MISRKIFKNQSGFFLVEILVALIIIGSTLALLLFALDRSEYLDKLLIKDIFLSNDPVDRSDVKLLQTFSDSKNRHFVIGGVDSNFNPREAIGKKVCPVYDQSPKFLKNTNFDKFEIQGIATTTQITFVLTRYEYTYIGLDSPEADDPDMVVFTRGYLDSKAISGQIAQIHIDDSVYSINSGPGTKTAIIAGNLLLVLMSGTTEHLVVFKVGDIEPAQLLYRYKLPLSGVLARSVSFNGDNGEIYIGTERNDGAEVFILGLDDLGYIYKVKTIEVGATVNYLYSYIERLYVLNTLDPEIYVYDTNTLLKTGEYDALGTVGNGKRLDAFGDTFVFGRTIHGNEISFLEVDNSQTGSSTFVESWGRKIRASVDDLITFDGGFLVLTTEQGGQLSIYSNASSSERFILKEKLTMADGRSNDLYCDANSLYISFRYKPLFYRIHIPHD